MNLQQLKYLVTIADCHSITKASKALFVSQPYLSKVVSDFETKIQKQLFVRYNSGLELTSDGHKVYLLAQSIIPYIGKLFLFFKSSFGFLWICQMVVIFLMKAYVSAKWEEVKEESPIHKAMFP